MTLPVDLRRSILDRDERTCRYCQVEMPDPDKETDEAWIARGKRRKFEVASVDHVDPWGGDGPDNLVAACKSCNSAKGRRTARRWYLDMARTQTVPPSFVRAGLVVLSDEPKAWARYGVYAATAWERRMAASPRVVCDACSDLPSHEIQTP